MEIIGIDISKHTFDASWVKGQQACHQSYPYTDEGLEACLEQLPEDGHYVMEATGVYHSRLALCLYQAGRRVSVVNPLVIKRYGQMKLSRAKSDKADAALIRGYGEANAPASWSPGEADIVELQQAHGWLHDLTGERTRLLNRQEAHHLRLSPSRFVDRQMKQQLKLLNQQLKEAEAHLELVVKKSFADLYERLQTIPSIGRKTAIELIALTHAFKRFEDVKSLSAYIGVSATTYQSGVSIKGKGSIAKLGGGRMRQLLYLCSWTAKSCNKACRALYARLKQSGKPAKLINIAIAHKLLRQAFAVATKNQPYSEEYA